MLSGSPIIGLVLCAVTFVGCREKTSSPGPQDSVDSLAQRTEAYFNKKIQEQPNNPEAYYGRAQHYFSVEHYERAIADLQQASQLAPDSGIYVYVLADLYMEAVDPNLQLPDSKKAISVLKAFSDAHPTSAEAMIELGWVLIAVEQYAELQALMDRTLKISPYNAEAWYLKGTAYTFSGDTAQAVRSLQASVELHQEAANVHYELGLLLDRSNPRLAISYYDNAYRFDTTLSDALYMKGFAYQKMGKYPVAMTIYRDLAKRDRQFSKAHYNMGYIWFEQDSLELAHRAFDRALGVKPDYVDAYYMRGLMSEKMGNIQQAKTDYYQTLNLDPTHRLAADGLDRLKDED